MKSGELKSQEYKYGFSTDIENFKAPKGTAGINSDVFVIISFADGLVIIGGTRYAGEIKKSIFSIMNHLLPGRGHLPMHCSSNTTGENTAVFFGLSGTGKTTLSADPERALVGDDEHGWSAKGVFNFEGGCYAKLIDLSEEDEPAIFATTRMPGSILENIIVDDDFSKINLETNNINPFKITFNNYMNYEDRDNKDIYDKFFRYN